MTCKHQASYFSFPPYRGRVYNFPTWRMNLDMSLKLICCNVLLEKRSGYQRVPQRNIKKRNAGFWHVTQHETLRDSRMDSRHRSKGKSQKSPTFCQKSPTFYQKSPKFNHSTRVVKGLWWSERQAKIHSRMNFGLSQKRVCHRKEWILACHRKGFAVMFFCKRAFTIRVYRNETVCVCVRVCVCVCVLRVCVCVHVCTKVSRNDTGD